ncbi:MAG: phenylacetate--CoA ligase [Betaproteobacteria bacterium]|nr:phenylacetate--CoA ligase [Betaproteobacteria bacterium]
MTARPANHSTSKTSRRKPTVRHPARFFFERSLETLPREQLARLQLQRLRATLKNAYEHVPLHRARLDALGIGPRDIRRLEDVTRLPFTVKSDLRDTYPFGLFARPREQIMRLHASSGTTGKPTVVGYTAKDVDNWASLIARGLACGGARPGDLIHNAFGYGLFTGGLGMHYGIERLGATVLPMSGGMTERQVQMIIDLGARVLLCTPSYALNIAEVAEREGVDLRQSRLEVGFFGAEPWSESLRNEVQLRLGVKAIDNYGLSEIIGPGVAFECEAQDGLHAWEDHFLIEVIDPESGTPVAEGEAGELVISTLTKEALPMIRYRTRDMTRLATERCGCGRTHLRLKRVTGRNDDMLIIRGVNVYPSQIEAVLVGLPDLAPHYQLVVERRGSLDELTIEVEAAAVPASEKAEQMLAERVRHQVKSRVGVTAEVRVKNPGELPRSQGKAVRVRDLRPKAGRG